MNNTIKARQAIIQAEEWWLKRFGKRLCVAAASLLFASLYMPAAEAGCGDIAIAHKSSWSMQPGASNGLFQRVSTLTTL